MALFVYIGPAIGTQMIPCAVLVEPGYDGPEPGRSADPFGPERTALRDMREANGRAQYVPPYLDPRSHEAVYEIDVPTGL